VITDSLLTGCVTIRVIFGHLSTETHASTIIGATILGILEVIAIRALTVAILHASSKLWKNPFWTFFCIDHYLGT